MECGPGRLAPYGARSDSWHAHDLRYIEAWDICKLPAGETRRSAVGSGTKTTDLSARHQDMNEGQHPRRTQE